ncbi:hypothetical protein MBOURGENBZM_06480 [Methanoculleus bourgensis]|nr:hypothetical protein MBOURGENBZM_06480 [Methanoculleus bourgensis]
MLKERNQDPFCNLINIPPLPDTKAGEEPLEVFMLSLAPWPLDSFDYDLPCH